jgi:hypothetical protein
MRGEQRQEPQLCKSLADRVETCANPLSGFVRAARGGFAELVREAAHIGPKGA